MRNIPRFISSLTVQEITSSLRASQSTNRTGGDLARFSKVFADYIGVPYAIPAPSGRAALKAILHALELPKGGEVIFPSLVFYCMPAIFQEFGLRPKFVDIDSDTYCLDTDQLESAITDSTVGIFPVHLYGRVCNMSVIQDIASRHRLTVIEDCAQSCGASFGGKKAGGFGNAGLFSFSPHKNISALGMGMALTGSEEVARKMTEWMSHIPQMIFSDLIGKILYSCMMRSVTRPLIWDYMVTPLLKTCDVLGFDLIEKMTNEYSPANNSQAKHAVSRMPGAFHGRVGLSQLEKLDHLNQQRILNGNKLRSYLEGVQGVSLPEVSKGGENIYASFVIRVENVKRFRCRLRQMGIDTHGGNMSVGPELPGLDGTGCHEKASEAVSHMVHIPVYPDISENDLINVSNAIKQVIGEL